MIELTRTNDPVLLSWLTFHLEEAGIDCVVFDMHTSVLEGSIGAIPRRVMVLEDQREEAQRVLEDAAPPVYESEEDESLEGGWLPTPANVP